MRAARNLPTHAVRLPLLGLSYAFEARERMRREYAELVRRGLGAVASLRPDAGPQQPLRRLPPRPVATQQRTPSRSAAAQQRTPTRSSPAPAKTAQSRRPSAAAAAAGAPGVASNVAERASRAAHREFV